MPAPLDVDREQVRMLVLEYGYAETARKTGINENTVRQWGNRYGWLEHVRNPQPLPKSLQKTIVTGVTKPADALQNAIIEDGNATKSAAMRYSRRVTEHAAQVAEDAPAKALTLAQDVKAVVQTAALAGSWQAAAQTQVNVAVLLSGEQS